MTVDIVGEGRLLAGRSWPAAAGHPGHKGEEKVGSVCQTLGNE